MRYSDCCAAPINDESTITVCPACSKACEFINYGDSNQELEGLLIIATPFTETDLIGAAESPEPEDEHPELNVSEG